MSLKCDTVTACHMFAGKLVSQLFGKVQDMLEGDHSLLFILIDEAGMQDVPSIAGCQHGSGMVHACKRQITSMQLQAWCCCRLRAWRRHGSRAPVPSQQTPCEPSMHC